MDRLIETLQGTLGESIPGILGALIILVIGYFVAVVIRTVLRKALALIGLNNRLKIGAKGSELDLETGISTGGYFLTLLVAILAVFNQLQLEIVSQPIEALVTQIFEFIPKLIGGGVLVLIAWLVATLAKQVLTSALAATGIDGKLSTGKQPLSQGLSEALYWLIWLLFLPGILGVFELSGLMAPVQSMVDEITGMLPNILAAVVIVMVGYFVAKIVRDLVTNLLAAAGADRLGEKAGLSGSATLSGILGLVAYLFVFVPALIAGLNALEMSSIADPATDMLGTVMAAIPDVIAAIAILVIVYYVARLVTSITTQLLSAMGADSVPQKMGFSLKGKDVVSKTAGKIIFFFMMLFAAVEAANRIHFTQFSELVTMFIHFGGQVLLGGAIIAVGFWLANLVHNAMLKASTDGHNPLAGLVRIVILGLVFSMGLRAMGLANDIVNMAFGITLGAAAIAVALAFGLGGRTAAGKLMDDWVDNLKGSSRK